MFLSQAFVLSYPASAATRSESGARAVIRSQANPLVNGKVVIVERHARQNVDRQCHPRPSFYVADVSRNECRILDDLDVEPLDSDTSKNSISTSDKFETIANSGSDRSKGEGFGSDEGLAMRLMRAIWLPAGWPQSVTSEYARYAICNVGRNTFRKANFVLGTSALLYALGLGSKEAITVSATLNWILKDGFGMVTKVSISSQISRILDRDPKLWRMLGDSLMVCSVAVELSSPFRPGLFLVLGSLSSLLRQAADAMSGPAYRVFLNSFAITSNIGDVSSRGESQVVLGNLLGLALGAAASTLAGKDYISHAIEMSRTTSTLLFFALFSIGHLFSTRLEVGTMCLRTLNWKRASFILESFVVTGVVPSVETANRIEPLFQTPIPKKQIVVGSKLIDFTDSEEEICRAMRYRDERYILILADDQIGISLHENADNMDILRALLNAQKVLHFQSSRMSKDVEGLHKIAHLKVKNGSHQADMLLEDSQTWTKKHFPAFESGLESAGWTTEKLLFSTGSSRYTEEQSRG